MNEIWDPLSEGMDRPFVQAIGVIINFANQTLNNLLNLI